MAFRVIFSVVVAVMGLAGVGCGGGPRMGRYNVEVMLGEGVGTGGNVEVDVVACNEAEVGRWLGQDMNTYPSSAMRRDAAKKTFYLSSAKASDELAAGDDLWNQWKGAQTLFVLTDLPVPDAGGASDPRRLVLPLDQARWSGNRIKVRVDRSGLRLLTEMVPEKK